MSDVEAVHEVLAERSEEVMLRWKAIVRGTLAPESMPVAPFVRLDSKESGFSLGLAIAKQAVDAHSGTIRVQNLPGKGCIFVLELPNNLGSATS